MNPKQIAKYVGIVAVLITSLIGTLQIWDWFKKPDCKLVANVYGNEFSLPPSLAKEFERMAESVSKENLKKSLKIEGEKIGSELTVEGLSRYLSTVVPDEIPFRYINMEGYVKIIITNKGTKKASEVSLQLPKLGPPYYRLDMLANGKPAKLNKHNWLELGEFQPKETKYIHAWTIYGSDSITYHTSDFTLTHNAGVGKVKVYKPIGPLGQAVDYWWFFILLGVVLILSQTFYFGVHVGERRGQGKEIDADSDKESQAQVAEDKTK
jgi:hypothetical protein